MVLNHPNKSTDSTNRCSRCGRLLTDPRSIAEGIGPVCKAKLQAAIRQEHALHDGGLDRFFGFPEPERPQEPEFLCQTCETPTPQSQLFRGECRACRTERELKQIEARQRKRELPIVAGQFSEV